MANDVIKPIRRYVVRVTNETTGVPCYLVDGDLLFYFSLRPLRTFNFRQALIAADRLRWFYPIVRVVAFRG